MYYGDNLPAVIKGDTTDQGARYNIERRVNLSAQEL